MRDDHPAMSLNQVDQIRAWLHAVDRLRTAHAADPAQARRVRALKAYQAQRFEHTYADLLAQPRYQAATRFFLNDLYGPQEFSERDTQFSRVVPALVRLFPADVVATVEQLGELHALSETLDDATARHLPPGPADGPLDDPADGAVDAAAYIAAWQAAGQPAGRERQIALTLQIGQSLDRFTRSRLLRNSLRLMRGPARAAGLSSLQTFLEAGFDAFGAMKGADDFLATIGQRERALAAALFAADATQRSARLLP